MAGGVPGYRRPMRWVADRLVRAAAGVIVAVATVAAVRAARRRRRIWLAHGGYRDLTARGTVEVASPRVDVFERCRDMHWLATVLDRHTTVEELDSTHYRWTYPLRDGPPVTCHAQIVGEVPFLLLAWAVDDGPFPHQGTLRFEPLPGGGRTRIRARLRYRWSSTRARESGIPDDLPARMLSAALNRLRLRMSATVRTG